jgi:hypothetical protein
MIGGGSPAGLQSVSSDAICQLLFSFFSTARGEP